jgi:hypothetical protein
MSVVAEGHILDTNLFNDVADGKVLHSAFAGRRLFATHVQLDELKNTGNIGRRGALCASFQSVAPAQLITSGAIWGVSKWGEAAWPEDDLLDRMRPVLEELDKKAGKTKKAHNQARDLLTAATALKKGLTLVTNDRGLTKVVQQFGGRAINATEFVRNANGTR